jgi:ornithine cyclodeaminase/alanine dehydrogenase-like protein (mu-crystallin family)
MPAANGKFLSAKVAAVNYQNSNRGLDSHQGALLLFEKPTGILKAVIDATELTAIRTTAVSCLFTKLLLSRRAELKRVAIVGAGVQAYHHIKMFFSQYEIRDFVVVSRSVDRVKELVSALDCDVQVQHRPYGASLEDVQLIVVATHANELALHLYQISANTLILGLGACRPGAQEISNGILDQCTFVTDSREACAEGSGEGHYVTLKNQIRYLELADLIEGGVKAPTDGILVFKSVGLGFEDLVCAQYLFEKCLDDPRTIQIETFGGGRAY